ncbi:hypothetical protein BON22_2277 [Cyberlindnera fabianii]|nr:hypothetical protein BON22_2277 [Cyberlindnera fabianii]
MSSIHNKIVPTRVLKSLKPEPLVPSISEAIKLIEGENETEKEAKFNYPRILESGAYQFTRPTKRNKYIYLMSSPRALEELGIKEDEEYKRLVTGEDVYYNEEKGVFPYAQAYAGFQFGHFAGQLGDGRVVNLFDIETPDGGRSEIQLKGAGKTAFSRFADGKAVIRSSIREFVICEALNGVGIPSSRALSISVLPGTLAQRAYAEKCAVISRFSPSWFRLGTFDLYRARKDRQGLRDLCDYLINGKIVGELPEFVAGKYKPDRYAHITDRDDPDEIHHEDPVPEDKLVEITDSTRYEQLYRAIVRLNARTVAYWQVYGFCNGVLNTDNTSVIGLSIDFGPFSFMDKFDPQYTPNDEDHENRYSYENQPSVVWWNLTRLAEAMVELLGAGPELIDDQFFLEKGVKDDQGDRVLGRAESIIKLASHEYKEVFMDNYNALMGQRLGLKTVLEGDNDLYAGLLDVLIRSKVDYNQFFVKLQESDLEDHTIFMSKEVAETYLNPADKIDREVNDELRERIEKWIKLYKERLAKESITPEERKEIASKVNPQFIPRNWMLDEVIREVEDSRGEEFDTLMKITKMSSYPYDPSKWGDDLKELEEKWLANEVSEEKFMTQCSCSS